MSDHLEEQPKRPISVWIAQILMMLYSALFMLPIFLFISMLIADFNLQFLIGFLLVSVVYLLLIGTMQLAFWGMVRRRSYGRWIAVGAICMNLGFSLLAQFARPEGPFEYYEYENVTQAAAGLTAQLVLIGAFLTLVFVLSFSGKVNRFFAGSSS